MARYRRRLSPLERYSLVIHEVCRYQVDGIIEGVGRIATPVLQAAVARAAEANPGIRVRLRGALGFSRWVDSGIAPQVRVLPQADWDGNSEQGAPFLAERLDPLQGGPVADILVVPCRDGMTRLVFRSVHAAIDGRGLIHWGDEVFRALRGEPLQGSPSTLTDLDVQRAYRDRVPPPSPPMACVPVIAPSMAPRELRYVWRRVIVHGNLSHLLPRTAAFLAAWARRREPGPVAFTIPVDYRGLRTQEMSIGNLIGYLRLPVEEDASPRSLMQLVNQGIREHADCRSLPGASLLRWLPIWLLLRHLRAAVDTLLYTVNPGLPSGGIVAMGSIRDGDFACDGFRPLMVSGIPGSVGKLNVVFVGCPTGIAVTFAVPAAYNGDGQLDELVQAYRQRFSAPGDSDGR